MADPAKKNATYQDVLDAPEHVVAELIHGVLHVHPRPAVPHARAGSRLGARLVGQFDDDDGGGPGGWVILFEPELHLGPDVVVPDLAGWRRERMPRVPLESAFIELAPDWVCEVLSPSTRALDRSEKMDVFAREGVAWLWFVEPVDRSLEVYRLEKGRWLRLATHRDAAVVRAEPFDAVELALARLWAS